MFDTLKEKLIIGGVAVAAVAGGFGGTQVINNMGKVQVVEVGQALVAAKQPFEDCHNEEHTTYQKNQKNGTEGAIIGGVGGAAVGGLIAHSWVGAGVGAAVGAVGGDLVERHNQPDYVAKKSESTKCKISYRDVQVPVGYKVSYLDSDGKLQNIVVAHEQAAGTKVKLKDLELDQVTPDAQQKIVQQAIGADANKS